MDYELMRNGSGYVDITAYKAMQNFQKEKETMEYKRGDIFEYETANGNFRYALIVSADFRSRDRHLNGILLTEEPKGTLTVPIVCQEQMYADCGMVSICADYKLGNYIRTATDAEMQQIDEGICKCLGLLHKTITETVEKVVEVPAPVQYADSTEELMQAKAEAKVYKDLYEKLLAKMIG